MNEIFVDQHLIKTGLMNPSSRSFGTFLRKELKSVSAGKNVEASYDSFVLGNN